MSAMLPAPLYKRRVLPGLTPTVTCVATVRPGAGLSIETLRRSSVVG